ncbi:LysR family transcriptional regulator, partial [Vibrio cholerae O1]|nr:LysR family transcriptional regulator [Vibrio cholerae O1]
MIDIVALRTLVALDALGSVTATADSLGYTPAAVSHQLQKLSRYLGAPVTERSTPSARWGSGGEPGQETNDEESGSPRSSSCLRRH